MVGEENLMKRKLILAILFSLSSYFIWANLHEGKRELLKANIPNSQILAFPDFDEKLYKNKIKTTSGNYYILSQSQVQSWARGQGFRVVEDFPYNNIKYNRAIYFNPPGLSFTLRLEKTMLGKYKRFGNLLALDFALLKTKNNQRDISSHYDFYKNLIKYEIIVDGILMRTFSLGYGLSHNRMFKIPLSYIRDERGRVEVEVRMANHPGNFGILYDASISN